jgi:hypothetical protein
MAILNRSTFRTSREMDFFSAKELTTQTGHSVEEWPLVFLKETIDNALDACEDSDTAPQIDVTADAGGISVSDNGPGLPGDTIAGALDFTVRVSNREMYVAPDRGAQGNALKTLLSMPYVVDPNAGRLTIASGGVRHDIICRADPVTQRPVIQDATSNGNGCTGTLVAIRWAEKTDDDGAVVWPFGGGSGWRRSLQDQSFDLLVGFALFNPHLSLRVKWFGEELRFDATDTAWEKWQPNKPTSPHWYETRHLERLIAAYISRDRERGQDRTVAKFVAEFDGLSGNAKRKVVLDSTGLSRVNLSSLVNADGMDMQTIATLLQAMQSQTKPVKPARLGIIGRDHFSARFAELGCLPDSFEYAKKTRIDDGLPSVVEGVFGWFGEGAEDRRRIFAGANWSAAIKNPFRSFGSTGEGLDAQLRDLRAGAGEPIAFALHLAHPRVEYTDRGKTAIVVDDDSESEIDDDSAC